VWGARGVPVLVLGGWGAAGCARALERGKSRCIDMRERKEKKRRGKK